MGTDLRLYKHTSYDFHPHFLFRSMFPEHTGCLPVDMAVFLFLPDKKNPNGLLLSPDFPMGRPVILSGSFIARLVQVFLPVKSACTISSLNKIGNSLTLITLLSLPLVTAAVASRTIPYPSTIPSVFACYMDLFSLCQFRIPAHLYSPAGRSNMHHLCPELL